MTGLVRLGSTWVLDLRRQAQEGFWLVALLAGLVVAALLTALGPLPRGWWPVVVAGELTITSFMFAAVQVARERGDGTLPARAVTPLRAGEYLAALAGSLTLLGVAETGVLVLAGYGRPSSWWWLGLGVAMTSVLLVLYGVVAVAEYESVTAFLLPSGAWTAALAVPLLPYLGGPGGWWLWLHPLQPALALVDAGFGEPTVRVWPSLLLGTAWCLALGALARRRLARAVVPQGAR